MVPFKEGEPTARSTGEGTARRRLKPINHVVDVPVLKPNHAGFFAGSQEKGHKRSQK
jgi:hypothetical protein